MVSGDEHSIRLLNRAFVLLILLAIPSYSVSPWLPSDEVEFRARMAECNALNEAKRAQEKAKQEESKRAEEEEEEKKKLAAEEEEEDEEEKKDEESGDDDAEEEEDDAEDGETQEQKEDLPSASLPSTAANTRLVDDMDEDE